MVGTARAARVVHHSTFAETTVHVGIVDSGARAMLDAFLAKRLQPSSQSTIKTARSKWWIPFCVEHGLEEFITSGHVHRGGIMASFVLSLAKSNLAYSTITGYIWAIVDMHVTQGYASPLSNVRDWAMFMHSVEVEVHRPSEPRLMVPWLLFVRAIPLVNLQDCSEVATLILEEIILFTATRSEIIPDTLSGFTAAKHLRCKDVRWLLHGYLEICFRSIKQDPLCKRPACVAGMAWRAIGPAVGIFDLLSVVKFYFCTFRADFQPDDPFLIQTSGQPLTYSRANAVARQIWARVPGAGSDVANKYSLGGLRVLSRNLIAGVAGSETARVQGMWESCDVVYDRPTLERVLQVPSRMADFAHSAAMPAGGVLELLQRDGMERLPCYSEAAVPGLTSTWLPRSYVFVSGSWQTPAPTSTWLPRSYVFVSGSGQTPPSTPPRRGAHGRRLSGRTPSKPRGWSDADLTKLRTFAARFRRGRIRWSQWTGPRTPKAAQHAFARYVKDP